VDAHQDQAGSQQGTEKLVEFEGIHREMAPQAAKGEAAEK
jgi:hypothetical protein